MCFYGVCGTYGVYIAHIRALLASACRLSGAPALPLATPWRFGKDPFTNPHISLRRMELGWPGGKGDEKSVWRAQNFENFEGS